MRHARPLAWMRALLLLVVGGVMAASAVAHAQDDSRALFIGNSYTAYNGLSGLVQQMMTEQASTPASTSAVTPGGYRLDQHARDASGAAGDTTLRRALVTDDPSWGTLVLQDQSQVGGFPVSDPTWQASRDGAVALAALGRALPARTVLYQTWGRRTGDDRNPGLFPDFSTMQGRLRVGYAAYAEAIRADGGEASVAPVGDAFARIFADDASEGGDPATAGTLFWRLYAGDGSHPSNLGSHLAAYTLFATMTGKDPRGTTVAPRDGVAADIERLQQAAFDVVLRSPLAADYAFVALASPPADAEWRLAGGDHVRPWWHLTDADVGVDTVRTETGAAMVIVGVNARLEAASVSLPNGGVHIEGADAVLATTSVVGDVFVRQGTWDARGGAGTLDGALELDPAGTLMLDRDGLNVTGVAAIDGSVTLSDALATLEAARIELGEVLAADSQWSVRDTVDGRQQLVFTPDAGTPDAGTPDAGTPDAGTPDAGTPDAGTPDAGTPDAGTPDAGTPDAGTPDAGTPDAGTPDAGTPDAGTPDAGTPDAGTPDASTAGGRDERVDLGSFGDTSASTSSGCAASSPAAPAVPATLSWLLLVACLDRRRVTRWVVGSD